MTTEWLHFCIFIVLFKVVVDGKICRVWRQLALIFLQKKCFLTPLNSLYCRGKDFEFFSFHEASGDHG